MIRKDVVLAILITLCLTTVLFSIVSVWSQGLREYDPWYDMNDDGKINLWDKYHMDLKYGTFGTPIDKSAWRAGLLLPLPTGAVTSSGGLVTAVKLLSIDLNQSEPGNQQVISVWKGTTITVSGEFQLWNPPGIILQAFIVYSWAPSWPPPNSSYYYPLYNGGPGPYPGVRQSFSFELTVPDRGIPFYLYYCCGAEYNMQDAVSKYTGEPWLPCAMILANAES